MKRRISYLLAVFVDLIMVTLTSPVALAQDEPMCNMTSIASLHHCVMHAQDEGYIDNAGIATSLLKKLDAAQEAEDRGQATVAVNNVEAFIHAVEAQLGKHIDAMHGGHMVEHAKAVIEALGG
ncbi:MAG: hypothetical protein KDE31_13665 [Caldilineaceae bacterium]|nr:hypothetical protein [Caldilineaceae bacterium]